MLVNLNGLFDLDRFNLSLDVWIFIINPFFPVYISREMNVNINVLLHSCYKKFPSYAIHFQLRAGSVSLTCYVGEQVCSSAIWRAGHIICSS